MPNTGFPKAYSCSVNKHKDDIVAALLSDVDLAGGVPAAQAGLLPDAGLERAYDLQHRPARHVRPLARKANPPSDGQPTLHGGRATAARHKQRISTCVDSHSVRDRSAE